MEHKAIGPLAEYLLLPLSLQCPSDDQREVWQPDIRLRKCGSEFYVDLNHWTSIFLPSALTLSLSLSPFSLSFLYLSIKFHSNIAYVLQY